MAQVGSLKHELQYGTRRPSLHWSKKAKNYPDVGEVWSTHRDERLLLILVAGRIGWTAWAFEVMDLESAEVGVIHCGNKGDQSLWMRHT